MATKKQTAANRRNAKQSTGPRTAQGKANSRFNALKHGIDAEQQIIFGETGEDLAHLAAEYHEQFQPSTPAMRFLVDTIVDNEWRLRRFRRVEAELWNEQGESLLTSKARRRQNDLDPEDGATVTVNVSAAETFLAAEKSLLHLQRMVNSCERNLHRALKELQRLQAAQFDAVEKAGEAAAEAITPAPQPKQSTPTSIFSRNEPNSPKVPPQFRPANPPSGPPAKPDLNSNFPETV